MPLLANVRTYNYGFFERCANDHHKALKSLPANGNSLRWLRLNYYCSKQHCHPRIDASLSNYRADGWLGVIVADVVAIVHDSYVSNARV
jgi:hypothetical protein